jgi:hypothetical protein
MLGGLVWGVGAAGAWCCCHHEAEAAVGMIISGFCREVRRGGQGRRGRRGS